MDLAPVRRDVTFFLEEVFFGNRKAPPIEPGPAGPAIDVAQDAVAVGRSPVSSEARVGEQYGVGTMHWSNQAPSRARRSRLGVWISWLPAAPTAVRPARRS